MGSGYLGICLGEVSWRLQPICVQQQEGAIDVCFRAKCGSLGSLCLTACIKVPNDLLDEIKWSV